MYKHLQMNVIYELQNIARSFHVLKDSQKHVFITIYVYKNNNGICT